MTCGEASCHCVKFTCKSVFSSIGLLAMVVGYVLLGAFLFQKVEGDYEKAQSLKDQRYKLRLRNEFIINLSTYFRFRLQDCSRNLTQYSNPVNSMTTASPIADLSTIDGEPEAGNTVTAFVNALGSGNSDYPCGADLGGVLKDLANYLEDQLDNYEKQKYNIDIGNSNGSTNGTNHGRWTMASSVLFATTVITTIGYGNLVPQSWYGQILTIIYAIIGVPLMLITLASMGNFMATCFRFCYNRCCSPICSCFMRICCHAPSSNRHANNAAPLMASAAAAAATSGHSESQCETVVERTDTDSARVPLRRRRREQKEIPIYLSLVVLTTYLVSIAALFKFWESWSWLKAIYFCFITFSTIGFGDIVPGRSLTDDREDSYKTALCAVSVLFGLVIMSMCFTLMQDTVSSYFRNCCQRLRNGSDEEDDDVDREESYMSVSEKPVNQALIKTAKKGKRKKQQNQSPV